MRDVAGLRTRMHGLLGPGAPTRMPHVPRAPVLAHFPHAGAAWNGEPGGSLAPRGYTPYVAPTSPPPGFYDPGLDAAGRAAQRGYDNLVGNTEDTNARSKDELGYNIAGMERSRGRTLADLLAGRTQFEQSQQVAAQREGQNYTAATGDLSTQYTRLGTSQTGNAEAAGVAGGGTLAAALKARTANHGHDQGVLDQQHTRFGEDQLRASNDFNAQYATAVQRVGEDYGNADDPLSAEGQASRQYGYGVNDSGKVVQQAGIENTNYQTDIGDQRWFQAQQAGYATPGPGQPGGRPVNEFTDPSGNSYRIVVRGSRRYRVTPSGTETFVGTRPRKRK